MSRLITCLWFAGNNGEEAAKYYLETFTNAPGKHEASLGDVTYAPKEKGFEEVSGRPAGSVLTAEIELDGMSMMLLNGGPLEQFRLNGGVSFVIECETQEEIDYFWTRLSAVPEAEQCGWCQDKYGVTWQVTPRILDELLRDPAKAPAVSAVFMPMKKLDLEAIRRAGE